MAETQLRGTIKLGADTREAVVKVKQFADDSADTIGNKVGKSFAQTLGQHLKQVLEERALVRLAGTGFIGQAISRSVVAHGKPVSTSGPKRRRLPKQRQASKTIERLKETITDRREDTKATSRSDITSPRTKKAKQKRATPRTISSKAPGASEKKVRAVEEFFNESTFHEKIKPPPTPPPPVPPPPLPPKPAGWTPPTTGETTNAAAEGGEMAGFATAAPSVTGPLMIAAGVVAVGAAFTGVIIKATDSLLGFTRGISMSSGPLSAVFALFDTKMTLLAMKLGNELAPAMGNMLPQLIHLAEDVLPTFTHVLTKVIETLTDLFKFVHDMIDRPISTATHHLMTDIGVSEPIAGAMSDNLPNNITDLTTDIVTEIADTAADGVSAMAGAMAGFFGSNQTPAAGTTQPSGTQLPQLFNPSTTTITVDNTQDDKTAPSLYVPVGNARDSVAQLGKSTDPAVAAPNKTLGELMHSPLQDLANTIKDSTVKSNTKSDNSTIKKLFPEGLPDPLTPFADVIRKGAPTNIVDQKAGSLSVSDIDKIVMKHQQDDFDARQRLRDAEGAVVMPKVTMFGFGVPAHGH